MFTKDTLELLQQAKAIAQANDDAGANERGLFALEYQLWTLRQEHWPGTKSAAMLSAAPAAPAPEALPLFVQPVSGDKLWLWQDGHKLLAYRHEYPCYSPGGDPCVLGEPVAEAEYRESYDRSSAP